MTFLLADSLPKAVLLNFEREKAERLRRLRHFKSCREAVNDSEEEIARDLARKIKRYLDQSVGACHLRRPDIAHVVANAFTEAGRASSPLRAVFRVRPAARTE